MALPFAPRDGAGAAPENGYAAHKAEEGKHARYPPSASVQGNLVPLAVETYATPPARTAPPLAA